MKNPNGAARVIKWLADPLAGDVSRAVERLSRADDAAHIAVMPDVHLSADVCVGTVLATRSLIYPTAVGGDIGCGMAVMAFDASADLLRSAETAGVLLEELAVGVPTVRRRTIASENLIDTLNATSLSHPRLAAIARRDGAVQLGTLGRGNHFLELQADEEDRLWLMVHSGSRAMGQAIRDHHVATARASRVGLPFLDARDSGGQSYLADARWAVEYAKKNRAAMVAVVAGILRDRFGVESSADSTFDCDHNHVRRETHFGEELWVHRKGASSAGADEPAAIAGSMGTESFHVEGRACPDSLKSSSHGAGRVLSRSEARRKISASALHHEIQGVWYDPRLWRSLCEEAPSAYKDIRCVKRAQRDLTRIRRRLRPLLSYKGG